MSQLSFICVSMISKNTINNPNDLLVAVDIGTTKLVILVGKVAHNGKLEILASVKKESQGIKNGKIKNLGLVSQKIQEAFNEVEEKLNFPIKNILVETGVAGDYIQSFAQKLEIARENSEELISKAEVDDLRTQMRKSCSLRSGHIVLDVLDQSFYVDGEKATDSVIGMKGKRLSGHFRIITGETTEINNFRHCIRNKEKNITANEPIVQPIASAAATLTEDEKNGGVILVDIGGGTTDIAIFSDGILRHTVMIPFGGHYITEHIQKAFNCDFSVAEMLKIQQGGLIPSDNDQNCFVTLNPIIKGGTHREICVKTLKEVLKEPVKTLLGHIKVAIDSYKQEISHDFENRIILTGGGSQLRDIQQATAFILNIVDNQVRLAVPDVHLSEETKKNDELKSPIYSTAIGLLVHTLEKKKQLLTEEKQDEIRAAVTYNLMEDSEEIKEVVKEEVKKVTEVQPEVPTQQKEVQPQIHTQPKEEKQEPQPQVQNQKKTEKEPKEKPKKEGFFKKIWNNLWASDSAKKFQNAFYDDDYKKKEGES